MSSTAGAGTLERVEQRQHLEPGDFEKFAHYVKKDEIVMSAITGNRITALCGKTWVPGRDPEKFGVCPECKDILDNVIGRNL